MPRRGFSEIAAGLLLLAAACASGGEQSPEDLLAQARQSGGGADAVSLYSPAAVIRRDHQPVFCGSDLSDYVRTLDARRTVGEATSTVTETFELGGDMLVFGTYSARGTLADGTAFRDDGRFARLWRPGPGGRPQIVAEVMGHPAPVGTPEVFRGAEMDFSCAPGVESVALEQALARQNEAMARAVQTHDAGYRIAVFAEDAIFMPYAHPDVVGLDAIAPYLTDYVDTGRGATFDRVKVWTDGAYDYGSHVVELSGFEVTWRAGDDGGVVSGGGLRLWRRGEDGGLRMLREIATHD